VAATGFLSGALSFLHVLSHLERVAHRLGKTCLFNNNHLPHLEIFYTQVMQPVSIILISNTVRMPPQGSTMNIQQKQPHLAKNYMAATANWDNKNGFRLWFRNV
jgi:hypothetical protein